MPRAPRIPRELSFLPFSASRATADGLLTREMLRGPYWHRLLPDIYVHADGHDEDDHRMWCEAVALKLPPGGAISGLSAAYLWGVDLLSRGSPVSVAVPGAARLRPHPRIRASYCRLSPTEDVTRFAGLPVTTGIRTAFDLARRPPRVEAVVAVDALLHRRVARATALAGYLDTHPGWPGNTQLREILTVAEPLTESPMETRLRLILLDAGAPRPIAQHEIHRPDGRFLARVDLAYPRWRIAIEYEGDHHRERAQFRRDVTRLNALRAADWIVLRFTADDVLRHPARIVHDFATAVHQRRVQAHSATGGDTVI